jgi:hypothetical protein
MARVLAGQFDCRGHDRRIRRIVPAGLSLLTASRCGCESDRAATGTRPKPTNKSRLPLRRDPNGAASGAAFAWFPPNNQGSEKGA